MKIRTRSMILLFLTPLLCAVVFYYYIVTPVWSKPTDYSFQVSPALLKQHVVALASISPPRNSDHPESLRKATEYIQKQWKEMGLNASLQPFIADGVQYHNALVELGPTDAPTVVIGAHYDVCGDQPGADDNASAVAGLIELTRLLHQNPHKLKYRFALVAFALEEPPYFATESMGSAIHAKSMHQEGRDVAFMVSLEMLGYFSDEENSQKYPVPGMSLVYPKKGNFIALISDTSSRKPLQHIKQNMAAVSKVPIVSMSAPRAVTGIDFSDHRNYWAYNIPAMMLSDTAFFRNPHYHEPTDTPETLDYTRMAYVVEAFAWAMMNPKSK